jgi:nitroreductase
MEVSQAIRMKRAVREFTDEALPEDQLEAVINAGRRAQSSKNTQPWHFVVVRDREILAELSKLGRYAKQLAQAAAAIVIVTPDPAERWSIMFDAGQAAGYMQLAAWDLGIGSCPVTLYEPDMARDLLGFPEDLHARIILSLGFPKDPDNLTASPHAGGRKALAEVTSYDHWEG